MNPDQHVVDCVLKVAGPGNPNAELYALIGILGALFIVALATVLINRNLIRDEDRDNRVYRQENTIHKLEDDAKIQSERNKRLTEENQRLDRENERLLALIELHDGKVAATQEA